jgi:indoleacetamide hydrolase
VMVSPTRDTVGILATSVGDVITIDTVLTGDDSTPPMPAIRLGIPRHHFWHPIDSDVRQRCQAALDRLGAYGVELIEIEADDVDVIAIATLDEAAGFTIAFGELPNSLGRTATAAGITLEQLAHQIASPDVHGLVHQAINEPVPAAAYRHAVDTQRPHMQAAYQSLFARYNISALVFPTVPVTAPVLGENDTVACDGVASPLFPTVSRNTGPASVAGIPAISLPCGLDDSHVGVGLELDGPMGSDRTLLMLARQLASVIAP